MHPLAKYSRLVVLAARLLAALIGALAVLSVGSVLDSRLAAYAPLLLLLGGYSLVTMALLLLQLVLSFAGRYSAALLLTGLMGVASLITTGDLPPIIAIGMMVVLVAAMLDRRFTVLEGSGVWVRRECGSKCFASMIVFYAVVALAALGVVQLGYMLGWGVGSLIEHVSTSSEALNLLLRTVLSIVAVRVALLSLVIVLVYYILVHLGEPVVFAVIASREAVRQHVERIVEEERRALIERRTWHQQLFISAVSHVAGVVAVLIEYAIVRIIALAALRLYHVNILANPGANMLWLILAPIFYYSMYRFIKRSLARSIYETRLPSIPKHVVLAALLALILLVSGTLIPQLLALLHCIYAANCIVPEDRGLARLIDYVVVEALNVGGAAVRDAAYTINAVVSALFGHGS